MTDDKAILRARMRAARDAFVSAQEASASFFPPWKGEVGGGLASADHDASQQTNPPLPFPFRAGRQAAGDTPSISAPPQYLTRLTPGAIVASYVPLGSEADPAPLADAALAAGCTLALPHIVDRHTTMRFLAWRPGTPLHRGPHGLRQPPADAPEIAPDIVLVPLVAFDARLHRLGQGAGYYDRALATLPDAWLLGIAWSVQQVASVPIDRWDVPLHGVATETAFLTGEAR